MSDPEVIVRRNPYQAFLLWGGAAAILVGIIVAGVAGAQLKSAIFTAQFTSSLEGYIDGNPSSPEIDAATGFMWFGWILSGIGVVMVIVFIAIKATTNSPVSNS